MLFTDCATLETKSKYYETLRKLENGIDGRLNICDLAFDISGASKDVLEWPKHLAGRDKNNQLLEVAFVKVINEYKTQVYFRIYEDSLSRPKRGSFIIAREYPGDILEKEQIGGKATFAALSVLYEYGKIKKVCTNFTLSTH